MTEKTIHIKRKQMFQDIKDALKNCLADGTHTIHFDAWDPPGTTYKVCNFTCILGDKAIFLKSFKLEDTESHASVQKLLKKALRELHNEYGITCNSLCVDNTSKVFGGFEKFISEKKELLAIACINHSLMLVFKETNLKKRN